MLRGKILELNLSFELKWSNLQILTLLQDLCSKRNILMSGQSRSAEIYYAVPSTLIGMRQGTFHPLSFLDQTLSAEFPNF